MKRFLFLVFMVLSSCNNPIENKKPNVIIVRQTIKVLEI